MPVAGLYMIVCVRPDFRIKNVLLAYTDYKRRSPILRNNAAAIGTNGKSIRGPYWTRLALYVKVLADRGAIRWNKRGLENIVTSFLETD